MSDVVLGVTNDWLRPITLLKCKAKHYYRLFPSRLTKIQREEKLLLDWNKQSSTSTKNMKIDKYYTRREDCYFKIISNIQFFFNL